MPTKITTPDDPALAELCERLAALSSELDLSGRWPAEQLRLCGEYGVFEWFVGEEYGGQAWDPLMSTRGYLALSAACLTTTFILTQRTGACRRIDTSANESLKPELLPALARGDSFATVGVSHLTTSGRHLKTPLLRAERTEDGFVLNGMSPWVTGGPHAEHIVIGAQVVEREATCDEQILIVLPTDLPGVTCPPHTQLVGLTASHTGQVKLDNVIVDDRYLLAGPVAKVMTQGTGGTTGGLQTSTLALGLSRAALDFIRGESDKREELFTPSDALERDWEQTRAALLSAIEGAPTCSSEQLRTNVNSLVLRSTQAALAAAKGAGYVAGHPVGRWCREALFFLVWSCPQPVVSANLCELAGISE
ncbi:acyl-CoA dehydrogenase family protein [Adhaeretor mobilis]|uniref:Glutaryl-CoA dehydrogenase n=1 Tax=Adhaeretor mobilis TaxID=1930276 RepID=A0A517N0V4_9BACT|nr:acyl-CoA dehydrogenase family protein [Adhaeretor mobilis]QDT00765.1 Glutaryl-CoA dehydrogenase [Adhaeretor mobilis]